MLPRFLLLVCLGIVAARDQYDSRNNYRDNYDNYNRDNFNSRGGYGNNRNATKAAVFCYINGTRVNQNAGYSTSSSNFQIQHVHHTTELCTHMVYGGAVVGRDGRIKRRNDDRDQYSSSNTDPFMDEFRDLRRTLGGELKKFISIGGSQESWRDTMRTGQFGQKVHQFLISISAGSSREFDGIIIDFQYAKLEEKDRLYDFLSDIKTSIRGTGKELGIVLPPDENSIEEGYESVIRAEERQEDVVDYYLLMAFEYFGSWSTVIHANAPIRARNNMDVSTALKVVERKLQRFRYKVILVVPFYGKLFTLEKPLQQGDTPIGKKFTNQHANTIMTYKDVCLKINQGQWTAGWDTTAEVPFVYKERQAIVYDNYESVKIKTALALRHGLGGVMAFSIDMDDFDGTCSNFANNDYGSGRNNYNRQSQYSQGGSNYGGRDSNYRDREYNWDSAYGRENHQVHDYIGRYPLLTSMSKTAANGSGNLSVYTSPLTILLAIGVALMFKF